MAKDCLRLYSVSFKTFFFLNVKIQKLWKVWHIRSSAIHMEKNGIQRLFFKDELWCTDVHTCGLVLFHNMKSAVFVF